MWVRGLLLALLLVAATAPGQAQMAPYPLPPPLTTLYVHTDAGSDMWPMNTQVPESTFQAADALPLPGGCGETLEALGRPAAAWYAFSSASIVEYDFLEDGEPRIHAEPGLARDVVLNQSFDPVLHWYVTTPAAPAGDTSAPAPGVVLRAAIRERLLVSETPGYDADAPLLMQGTSQPAVLAGPATQGATWSDENGTDVYHFELPLSVEEAVIPASTGFVMSVEAFLFGPLCQDEGQTVGGELFSVYAAPGKWNRMDLAVLNGLQLEKLDVSQGSDSVWIRAQVVSPWGVYDVRLPGEGSLDAELRIWSVGTGSIFPNATAIDAGVQAHGLHPHAARLTYYVGPQDGLAPGRYHALFFAYNDQMTAVARANTSFEIGEPEAASCQEPCGGEVSGRGHPTPGMGPVVALLALAMAAFAIARRS